RPFSNNCGPASLAMALRTLGQMPGGLNPEQQIDYARYLITSSTNQTLTIAGTELKLDDNDTQTLGFGQIANAENRNDVPMTSTTGWAALDNSLAVGHPVVAAGHITPDWKDSFPAWGTYGSVGGDRVGHFIAILGKTPDGKYLVSDPMWTNGSVAMTLEELKKFTGSNPSVTTVGH
ncbi:MAG TPA: C39 family peptidase, partial [Myxococcales bacterium]|nr:C39 family peptidase [Myxococcales bacterium]